MGTPGAAHEWAVSDTAGQCHGRCEASVCGMVARVCAVRCYACVLCAVCAASGEDVGWFVGRDGMMRETGCEPARVVVWWCVDDVDEDAWLWLFCVAVC